MSDRLSGGDRTENYLLRRQRAWLLEHFRADRKMLVQSYKGVLQSGAWPHALDDALPMASGGWTYAFLRCCRCWCCGKLLGERALFVSKVDPAGTTRRSNIRPACADHAA